MNAHADTIAKLKAKFWNKSISSYHAAAKLRAAYGDISEQRVDAVENQVGRAYRKMLQTLAPTVQSATEKLEAMHQEFGSADAIPAHDVAVVLADLKRLGST
jgi:hypothetical protein